MRGRDGERIGTVGALVDVTFVFPPRHLLSVINLALYFGIYRRMPSSVLVINYSVCSFQI